MGELAHSAKPGSSTVVVPRITIQAFCEMPQTAEVFKAVCADRRLAKTTPEVHMGGISGAVGHFTNSPTPNLLIVESSKDRNSILAELGDLAYVCDPNTKVVVLGHVNDIVLYQELIKAGVSDYIAAPFEPAKFIDSISRIFSTPGEKPIGKVYAFIGMKGGAGSSTIAHNIGWIISKTFNEEVAISDFDLAFGTLGLNFNHDGFQGMAEALEGIERLDDLFLDRLLTKCSEHLSLLLAPGIGGRDYGINSAKVEKIIELMRSNVPCTILDLPTVWEPWVRTALVNSDEIIITAVPDLATLRNVKSLVDMLKEARPNDAPPRIIFNQVGVAKRPEISIDDFSDAVGLKPSATIPFDAQLFGEAANDGRMITEISKNNKVADELFNFSQFLMGNEKEDNTIKEHKSLLGPLIDKFSLLKDKK